MNNAVPFPHEEREAGRPTERVSMIHDQLIEVMFAPVLYVADWVG